MEEKRGGARAGAGRKPKVDRVCRVAFPITELAKAKLKAYADQKGISLADAATEIFERLPLNP